MSLAPAKVFLRLPCLCGVLALMTAAALGILSAASPTQAFELFGRKFFESNDETIVVPDAQPYTLELTIIGADSDLTKAVRNASSLAGEEERPPPGTAGLIARARGDYGRILAALYSNGHYGGSVNITIDGVPADALRPDAELPHPVPVTIAVDPGPLFHFGEIRVDGLPSDPMTGEDAAALSLDDWELVQGEVARSGAIIAAETRMVDVWRQRGHPRAEIVTREVVADHRQLILDVTLVVEPGPAAQFGAPQVTGTERIDPAYARYMTGIRAGEQYDPDTVERARQRLQDLGVFASVSVDEDEAVGLDGILPITFVLSERKRHLIGGGVSYATIDGATLEGYWMHRNLFGHAESLRFDASISRIFAEGFGDFSYAAATTFRRPGVFTPNTDMTLRLSGERETVDTYESTTFAATAGLEHRFTPRLTASAAVNAEWAEIEDPFGTNEYRIVSLPSKLDYDGRDNKLDPTDGLRGTLDAEPFADIMGGTIALVAKGTLSGYLSVADDDRMVLAARGSLGSIIGGDIEDIPATRRFYLGGGGSIRGYEYRSIGPEIGGEVVGGLSFFETSLEFRYRLTDTIGLVPFVDAGAAYEESFPDFSEDIRIGAGLGLRYYTPLGPLRFDIAVPLNPDDDDDGFFDAFAFYVGLGQAF